MGGRRCKPQASTRAHEHATTCTPYTRIKHGCPPCSPPFPFTWHRRRLQDELARAQRDAAAQQSALSALKSLQQSLQQIDKQVAGTGADRANADRANADRAGLDTASSTLTALRTAPQDAQAGAWLACTPCSLQLGARTPGVAGALLAATWHAHAWCGCCRAQRARVCVE